MAITKHIQHVRSSVSGKTPTASDLYYGEIAVNYNSEAPALYIKNSNNEVIKVTSDAILSKDYESTEYSEYLVPNYPSKAGDNLDVVTKNTEKTISSLTEHLLAVEETFAYAVNQQNLSSGFNDNGEYTGATSTMKYINNTINLTDAVQTLDDAINTVDESKINSTGDTMSGQLKIANGGLAVTGETTILGNLTATSVYASSDETLKHDISNVTDEELAKAKEIQIKSYVYNSDVENIKHYGVIAQDVEKIGLDNLVHTDYYGVKSVDYISLLSLKIQQLEQEIKELKSK